MTERFLYVTGSLGPGGSERQLLYLAEALRGEGHDVTVAVWNFREEDVYVAPLRACGVDVEAVRGRSRLAKILHLRKLIRTGAYRVVHSFTFYLNFIAQVAALGTGATPIGSVRSTLALAFSDTGPVLARLSARWPRRQIYNNDFAATEAGHRVWWRPARIEVVSNHLDAESIACTEIANGTPRLLGIGSLLRVKRWDRLVDAARCLRSRGREFFVSIAGEGPLREELQKQIDEAGLADRVELLGYLSDVAGLLAGSTLLVHVSDSEGAPNVIIEAMAAGRPVVATAVGDTPLWVRDGETGFLVPSHDAGALCDRLELLIADRDQCVAMGRRAREVAVRRFGSTSLVSNMLNAYQTLGWS